MWACAKATPALFSDAVGKVGAIGFVSQYYQLIACLKDGSAVGNNAVLASADQHNQRTPGQAKLHN